MKKAVLLLGMVTIIAGCIYLKNADMDTVLFEQQYDQDILYVEEYPIEYTEEIVKVQEEPTEESAKVVSTEEMEEEIESESVESADVGGFAYSRLQAKEQEIYIEILNSLLSCENETKLSTTDPGIIDKAFNCVMLDHPEIFYVDGYKYTEYTSDGKVEKIVFTGNYIYEEMQIQERRKKIEAAVQEILAGVPDTGDEYQKVKYLYDTLVKQTEYDLQSVDNQNICSVFLNGKSVCQGYAKAIQYLMHELKMECVLVLGTVTNGEGHAWNLISVNGEWYYMDATWGDAFYMFGDSENTVSSAEIGLINYDYLCVTTEQIMKTHTINMPVDLPECMATADNYYIREGLYFTAFDEEKMKQVFASAVSGGQDTVTIKCSEVSVYEETCRILLDEQKIFEYLSTDEPVAYTDNKEQCSLTFWL